MLNTLNVWLTRYPLGGLLAPPCALRKCWGNYFGTQTRATCMQVEPQIFFRMVPEKLNFKIWKIANIEHNSVIFQARNSRFCMEVGLDHPHTITRENFSNTSELSTFTPAMSTWHHLPYFYHELLVLRTYYPTFSYSPIYGKQSWGAPTPLSHPTTMQNF